MDKQHRPETCDGTCDCRHPKWHSATLPRWDYLSCFPLQMQRPIVPLLFSMETSHGQVFCTELFSGWDAAALMPTWAGIQVRTLTLVEKMTHFFTAYIGTM